MKRLEDILICPKTKQRLVIDWKKGKAFVKGTDVVYPVIDGIIDFIPGIKDEVSDSYDAMSAQYDAYMASSNSGWKIANWFTWGFADDEKYARQLLTMIPDDFNGVLLDVPAGTGILTLDKYKRMKDAGIIAVDYSLGMLRQAKKWYTQHGVQNVILLRADVGNLPVGSTTVDGCICMNGFHIFPAKTQALREITRVMKADSDLACCFYVKSKRKLTDLLVRTVLQKQSTFKPPYYSEHEVLSLFQQYFDILSRDNLKSIFYFSARRKCD